LKKFKPLSESSSPQLMSQVAWLRACVLRLLTHNTDKLISLYSVNLFNVGLLAVITWLQLYSNFTYVKSKQKSYCLILFASFGSYTASQQQCASGH